jgi:hypothetical protein
MLTVAVPAAAAPPSGPSPIGNGALVDTSDYIQAAMDDGNPDTELDVGDVRDNACQTIPGTVAPGDIPQRYRDKPPAGDGHWEYQVCAESAAAAATIVQQHPNVASARAFCDIDGSKCAVFVYWRPDIPPNPPDPDEARLGYFKSFFTLSPDLGSSPHRDSDFGYITNLPTWFWNRIETRFPRALGDLGLFGGIAATAWHLNTTFETDGREACDVSGLRKVGTEWDAGQYAPNAKSPSNCGYTYTNIGTYNIHACSTWLIVAIGPFFAIVFPITLCNNWNVPVKESQILTGGDATRARVGG